MRPDDIFGPAVFGSQYDATFGALIDYARLSDVLLEEVPPGTGFLDLACGTGRLLEEIRARTASVSLGGVDLVEAQLEIARGRVADARLILDDVLELSRLELSGIPPRWVGHAGFGFLNLLPAVQRCRLFAACARHDGLQEIWVEVWSPDHQQTRFTSGTWYEHSMSHGFLRARNRRSRAGEVEIEFQFFVGGSSPVVSVQQMFEVSRSEIEAEAGRSGWRLVRTIPCTYRREPDSHLLLVFSRDRSYAAAGSEQAAEGVRRAENA
ncbi:MAG: class I SAM-dependent methyltransferase [Acidobacteriota bacterium]